MPSAGIRPAPKGQFKVYWRLDDGSQGSKTFRDRDAADSYYNRLKVQWDDDTWVNPSRSRIRFDDWADEWWETWRLQPGRSPKGMESTESLLRTHLRPAFGRTMLRGIGPQMIQRWQNDLAARLAHSTVMKCRSIMYRILQAAEDEGRIAANPLRKVRAPAPEVDPEAIFGRAPRRTFSPEEFGRLLASCLPFYWDHFIVQVGTGLRGGELLGLHRRRVYLAERRLEVLDVRYEAGKFGTGYKNRPKSTASIRSVPLSPLVAAAVARRLETAKTPDALVFPGPGGGFGVKVGSGEGLSTGNYRRVYRAAAFELVRDADGAPVKDERGRLVTQSRFPHLRLHGPHDLRATYATWLEDAAIPSRVIDELMGHESGGHASAHEPRRVSRMGALYRETTPEMLARVTGAIDARLTSALRVAASLLPEGKCCPVPVPETTEPQAV